MLLTAPTGRRAYPDFFFRAQGVVVEREGYRWHGSRAQHQRDTARFNDLMSCAEVRRILRFTASDVYRRPGAMIRDFRDIRGALAQHSGLPAVPVAGGCGGLTLRVGAGRARTFGAPEAHHGGMGGGTANVGDQDDGQAG